MKTSHIKTINFSGLALWNFYKRRYLKFELLIIHLHLHGLTDTVDLVRSQVSALFSSHGSSSYKVLCFFMIPQFFFPFQEWRCFLTSLLSSLYHFRSVSKSYWFFFNTCIICCSFRLAPGPDAGWFFYRHSLNYVSPLPSSLFKILSWSPLTMSPFTLPPYLFMLFLTYIWLLQVLSIYK